MSNPGRLELFLTDPDPVLAYLVPAIGDDDLLMQCRVGGLILTMSTLTANRLADALVTAEVENDAPVPYQPTYTLAD